MAGPASSEELCARVDELLEKYGHLSVEHGGSVPSFYAEGPLTEGRTQSLVVLTSLLGPDHLYVKSFAEIKGSYVDDVAARAGILRAVREDIAGGHLSSIRRLVSAEVFTDFLDIADHLNAEGYLHAAASIAGA